MSMRRLMICTAAFIAMHASVAGAGEFVPFRGNWEGSTVSATFLGPGVVFVVSSGVGNAAHLGRYKMTSPHLSYLETGIVDGTQIFTAANGDMITATIGGQLLPTSEGTLAGTLAGTITGGTGRFKGATGTYDFHIVARPGAFGFDSTAVIDGVISK